MKSRENSVGRSALKKTMIVWTLFGAVATLYILFGLWAINYSFNINFFFGLVTTLLLAIISQLSVNPLTKLSCAPYSEEEIELLNKVEGGKFG